RRPDGRWEGRRLPAPGPWGFALRLPGPPLRTAGGRRAALRDRAPARPPDGLAADRGAGAESSRQRATVVAPRGGGSRTHRGGARRGGGERPGGPGFRGDRARRRAAAEATAADH